MIQRIQSIYLLLAAGFFSSSFVFPYLTTDLSNAAVGQPALADGQFNLFDNIGLLGLAILGAILSVGAIFLYSNRSLQSKVAALITLIGALMFILAAIASQTLRTHLAEGGRVDFGLGWIAPVAAVVFSRLAARSIRKDEQLIKSMDRLR